MGDTPETLMEKIKEIAERLKEQNEARREAFAERVAELKALIVKEDNDV